MPVSAAFDQIAASYDETWTCAPAGRMQRDALWRNLAEYFHPGDYILDLGCGTGEDAVWLSQKGARVTAIDASPEMVSIARRRGIAAQVRLPIEHLQHICMDSTTVPYPASDRFELSALRFRKPVSLSPAVFVQADISRSP